MPLHWIRFGTVEIDESSNGGAGMFIFYIGAIIFNSWLVYQCTLCFSFGNLKGKRK